MKCETIIHAVDDLGHDVLIKAISEGEDELQAGDIAGDFLNPTKYSRSFYMYCEPTHQIA